MLILPSFSIAVPLEPAKQYEPAQFTLQTFNRDMNVTTFVSPDYSNETIVRFLRQAKTSIYVEIYQFLSPAFLSLIEEIHTDNPSMDIKVMISEHVVSEHEYNVYTMWYLTQLGIPVRWTSDTFSFSHQKFVIIDNVTTIVQAGNWAKLSVPLNEWESGTSGGFTQKNYIGNREFNIAMTDEVVTQYYRDVFDYDWGIGSDYSEGVDGTGTPLTWEPLYQSYYPRVFDYVGEFSGPMNVTPVFSPDTSLEAMKWVINSAQATLDIQIVSASNISTVVDELLDTIVAAKHRGVTVRIIMADDTRADNAEVALAFAEENIPVFWIRSRFMHHHNKAFIADGRVVLISSINWSEDGISENREAGVVVEHDGVGAWYQTVFDYDWGLAEYDAPEYVNVGWYPHIPTSSSEINVTVYAHEYYNDIDVVKLGVKINDGAWTNYTITGNVYDSDELDPENFFHVIGPQPDGSNITVIGYVESLGVESKGLEMVIPVRDSIGSVVTTPTTPTGSTTPTTPPPDTLMELLPYIVIAVVAAIAGLCFKKRR